MNKKLIALAIATAFAAPVAMADSGNVKISGKIHVSFDSTKGGVGGSTDNQTISNVSSNASRVAFSGDEDLGNGLKTIWQVETETSLGGTGSGDGTVGNRNSFLGLTGGFGTVLMGKNETPFKEVGRKVDLFGDQIGDNRNIVSASNAAGSNGNQWDLRPSSVVAYASPSMAGFKVAAAYATNTSTTANTLASTSAQSVAATYENGPVFVGLGYERHNVAGSTLTTAPTAWRLSAGFDFGSLKLVGLYQTTKDNNATEGVATVNSAASNPTTTSDDDRNAWGLGAAFKMGSNTLKAQYYRAGDFGNISDTGANMWALGVDHAMSKRTTAYVAYARTANDTRSFNSAPANASAFSVTGGGHGDNAGSIAGQNTNSVSVGMMHSF